MRKKYDPWRPHPWHGVSFGERAPEVVTAYIEITPFDGIKYEIDKDTGYLKVDRPQRTSSLPPTLYGFVPKTYCHDFVAGLSKTAKHGDGDPLDICVFSERPISRSEILLPARVIGGICMIDRGEADDKIIAVLDNDPVWQGVKDVSDLDSHLRTRLEHYFRTYKLVPGAKSPVKIEKIYGRAHAHKVVKAAIQDYKAVFS